MVSRFHLVVLACFLVVGLHATEYQLNILVPDGAGISRHKVFYNTVCFRTEVLEDFLCSDFSNTAFSQLVLDLRVFFTKQIAENKKLNDFHADCVVLNNFLKKNMRLGFNREVMLFFKKFREAIFSTDNFDYVRELEKFLEDLYWTPRDQYPSVEDGEMIEAPGKSVWGASFAYDQFKAIASSLRIDTSYLLKKEYIWLRLQEFLKLGTLKRVSAYGVIKIFTLDAVLGHEFFLKGNKDLLQKFKHTILLIKSGLSTKSTRKNDYTKSDFDVFISSFESEEDRRCVLACLQNILFTSEELGFSPSTCFYEEVEPVFAPIISTSLKKKRNKKKKKENPTDSDQKVIELAARDFLLGGHTIADGLLFLANSGSHVFEAPASPTMSKLGHDEESFLKTASGLTASPLSTGSYDSQSIAAVSPLTSHGVDLYPKSPISPLGVVPFSLDSVGEGFSRRQNSLSLAKDFSDSFVPYRGAFKPSETSFLSDDELADFFDDAEIASEIVFLNKLLSVDSSFVELPFLSFKELKKRFKLIKKKTLRADSNNLLQAAFRSCFVLKREMLSLAKDIFCNSVTEKRHEAQKTLAEKRMELRKFQRKIIEILASLSDSEWTDFCLQNKAKGVLCKKACIEILSYSAGVYPCSKA
jgi:hypothetical protein